MKPFALLAAAALAAAPLAATADDAAALTTQIQSLDTTAASRSPGAVTGRIAADFQSFAGSPSNSFSLVDGLRGGSAITLTAPGEPSATFVPATGHMGYGNVSTSLALAQYQLGQQGITSPTPLQLQTALNGGTITANGQTVTYQGVLQMRAAGMGWGEIAQASGTKLGPVVSGVKTQSHAVAAIPARPASASPAPAAGVARAPAGQGIVTAAGGSPPGLQRASVQGDGRGSAQGAGGSKGVVKASGAGANGVTTASGGAGKGHGIVTAAGSGASSSSAAAAGGGKGGGIVTAGGAAGGQGNGKAVGHSK
jgi:hypothetical protein